MPLELKTGPTPSERMGQASHRAQVILYTAMLESTYVVFFLVRSRFQLSS